MTAQASPQQHHRPSPPSPPSSPSSWMSRSYLAAYNALSLALWAGLLARTLARLLLSSSSHSSSSDSDIYDDLLWPHLVGTQSLALLEVAHAALGLVAARVGTTALQVGGKNLVVWTVAVRFPAIVGGSSAGRCAFVGCLLAWGASEVVRYGFFTAALVRGDAPGWLRWLRYSAFIVLYPPGLLSEAALVYLCLVRADDIGVLYRAYLLLGLLTYIPAGYILYTYMLKQRQRALK
ncbi:protein tyrosine phosphatase [Xylariaceae sp. FL0804]|nr:protein tyrosine phosphatase [Xylariaceae sp. FL0804]